MTNSDRLQEIRERAEMATLSEFIAEARTDMDYLLQLVTKQENEIAWLRTWIFQLQPDHELAAQKLLKVSGTEEGMTIDQVRDYLGIKP